MEVRAGRILAACSDPIVYFGMVQSCQDRACIWHFMALQCMVWYGMAWQQMVWYGRAGFGVVLYGTAKFGMFSYDMV